MNSSTSDDHDDDPTKSLGKSRTLFDIIRDEESGTAYKNLVQRYSNITNNHHHHHHRSKSLRDLLRIRPSSSASRSSSLSASSSKPVPASDVPLQPSNRTQSSLHTTHNSSHQSSLQRTTHSSFQRTQSSLSSRSKGEDALVLPTAEEYQEEDELLVKNGDDQNEEEEQQHINNGHDNSKTSNIFNNEPPVRMSLLDLLEETDRQAGLVGRTYLTTTNDDEDEEEGEEDQVAEKEEEGGDCVCCVCMVRHKGAAFIPCGHTFCRLCSRELWASRGNCPICNGYILEILDIF